MISLTWVDCMVSACRLPGNTRHENLSHRHGTFQQAFSATDKPRVCLAWCRSAIIYVSRNKQNIGQLAMEAEQLNAIGTTLADLRTRAGELRGYL